MNHKKNLLIAVICSLLFSMVSFAQKKVTTYFKFQEIPVNSIKPKGWLNDFLVNQKNGLTGHLDEVAGYPFTTAGWGKPVKDTVSWWPYEQTAYWYDGLVKCAYLLNDDYLIQKADKILQYELQHDIQPDGFWGPAYMKRPGHYWPYAVFSRALIAKYQVTKDTLLLNTLKKHMLLLDYSKDIREGVNIESLLNIYKITGDKALFIKAEAAFQVFLKNDLVQAFTKGLPYREHGVTYTEAAKIGAVMYMYTGNKDYLKYSVGAFDILDKYYMMADGVNVSSEHLNMPVHSLQSHETCDISDYTWSLGYLLMTLGDVKYADKIEKAIFNAATGCVTNDFKALQYMSCPNQVIAAVNSNHNKFFKGNQSMAFAPNPFTECCAGNVNRMMPNFAARMWMQTSDNGIAAVFYSPSELSCLVGKDNQPVKIIENTSYPFSDEVEFVVQVNKPCEFPFQIRIPEWSQNAELYYNGEKCQDVKAGSFYTLKKKFKSNDKIKLVLPSKPIFRKWADGGISIEKGPLVYALNIKQESRIRIPGNTSTKEFPAYEFYPASEWNYALCIDTTQLDKSVKFVRMDTNGQNPWEVPPFKLVVPAKKVSDWALIIENSNILREQGHTVFVDGKESSWKFEEKYQVYGEFVFTPPLPSRESLDRAAGNKIENIELVPYGAAKLRITIFPLVK